MRIVIFEGTPEEFESVQHLLNEDSNYNIETGEATTTPSIASERVVTVERDEQTGRVLPDRAVIEQILDRISIPNGQRALYRALYAGRDRYLNANEAAEAMGRTKDEFHGVLGALGRRIGSTSGVEVPEGWSWLSYIMHIVWEDDHWVYRLHPETIEVLEEKNLVL